MEQEIIEMKNIVKNELTVQLSRQSLLQDKVWILI